MQNKRLAWGHRGYFQWACSKWRLNCSSGNALGRLWKPFWLPQGHLTSSIIWSIQALLSEAVTAPKKKERKAESENPIWLLLPFFLLDENASGPTPLHQLGQTWFGSWSAMYGHTSHGALHPTGSITPTVTGCSSHPAAMRSTALPSHSIFTQKPSFFLFDISLRRRG